MRLGLALVAVLAFGVLTAGAAQAKWRIEGKTFFQQGISEETYASTGTFEMEWTHLNVKLINCKEAGVGRLYELRLVEQKEVTLTGCNVKNFETQCVVEPIHFRGTHGWGTKPFEPNEPKLEYGYLTIYGASCPWTGNFGIGYPLEEPEDMIKYGPEAIENQVTTKFTTKFGETKMIWSGSSAWHLTGPFAGKPWGWT